jgi:predicted enzyme related to lactoylglutathione lyase
MVTRTGYDEGTPSWVDLMSPDIEASKAFYSAVFGWEGTDSHDDGGNRVYTNFTQDGQLVAGLGILPQEMIDAGIPPMWSTYIATDDVVATVEKAVQAGGQVAVPAMDIMDQGRMAFITDPTGGAVGLWQAGAHKGAELVNEHASLSWNELNTRDVEGAMEFYRQVFGYTYDPTPMGPDMPPYQVMQVDGQPVAGINTLSGPGMEQVPVHWGVYFTVDDVDATLQTATGAGARVVMGPEDTPFGRFAVLHGPQGETFNLITPPDEDPEQDA